MKNFLKITFVILPTLMGMSVPGALLAKGMSGIVIRVVDGDSLLVNNKGIEENVRLIGIDAPEAHDNPKAEKDAERDSEALSKVLSRGKESAEFVRSFVHPGDRVRVETDTQQRDPYGRLLGYVYLSDGILLNEQIVRAGYAVPLTIEPNVKLRKKFEDAYVEAAREKRGLWDKTAARTALAGKNGPLEKHPRKRGRKRGIKTMPGPQWEVSDQVEVSDQKEVSGTSSRLK